MARDSKGITQFYLPSTHEPYLPLLLSCRASPPFGIKWKKKEDRTQHS